MKEILVAGGGIGGLSAALALALKGRRVRVLEKAPEFGEIGYGIQMGPNVAKMLDRLGVLEAIESHAFFPESLIFADAIDNREITRIAVGKFFRQRYGYRYFVIHRRDLHGEILKACRGRGEIALETSRGLASFEQRGDTVLVRCEGGEEYEGAALVGADGLRSVARQAVIGDGAPRMAGHFVYRGVVPMDEITDRSRADAMTIWGGPDLHLVQYRLRGGTVMNNVATIASRRFKRGEKDAARRRSWKRFSGMDPHVRDMLRLCRGMNWVDDRDPATNWTKGRVTLLGDAAHPTLQYLAQGAQMAIEDAVVLAEKVATAGEKIEAAFHAYQHERMNRSARVVLSSRFFGEVLHADAGARALRNDLLRRRSPEDNWEFDWLSKASKIRP
jgi:salicylate hydroxylase